MCFSVLPRDFPTCSPFLGGTARPRVNLSIPVKPTPPEALGLAVFPTFPSPEPDGEEFRHQHLWASLLIPLCLGPSRRGRGPEVSPASRERRKLLLLTLQNRLWAGGSFHLPSKPAPSLGPSLFAGLSVGADLGEGSAGPGRVGCSRLVWTPSG